LEIGSYSVASSPLTGTISRAQVWDNGTAAGTAVVDADFRNLTTTLTDTDTFVATSGQTVTINGGATARRKITLNPDGFLHLDGVSGSYASIPDPIGALGDFTLQADGLSPETVRPAANVTLISQYASGNFAFQVRITTSAEVSLNLYTTVTENHYSAVVPADTVGIRVTRVGTLITYWVDTGSGYVSHDTDTSAGTVLINTTSPVEIGSRSNGANDPLLGTISRAQVWDNGTAAGTAVLDADFRDNPSTLGDTDTLAAATGQTITINGGATAYAARVKAPKSPGYLHLPGTNGNAPAVDIPSIAANEDFVFEMEVYLVDASNFHLASGANSNNRFGIFSNGFYFAPDVSALSSPLSTGASTLTVERSGTTATLKQDGVTKATQTHIADNDYTFTHLSFNGQYGTSIGRINGYIKKATLSIEGTEVFNVDFDRAKANATSFVAKTGQTVTINQSTLTGDRAKIVKNSEIFYDGLGDEFDFTLSSTFTGKTIVASTQGILVADVNRPAGAHQIDSRGLGNVSSLDNDHALEQKGMMYLSPSSSPAALTSAFVARGAVKSFAARTDFQHAFRNMGLTSFPTIDTSNGVDCSLAFQNYEGTSFPALNFASATSLSNAWYPASSLTSLPAIQAPVCSNFASAWRGNTALATIDPNANFGESATGVNFNNAFKTSGLTTLPAGLNLSKGDTFSSAFQSTPITSIGEGVLLGTASANVQFTQAFHDCTSLTNLPSDFNLSTGADFQNAFFNCSSLVNWPTGVFDNLSNAYTNCFINAWNGCTSLSGASVYNILSSIDTSGQSAPSTGPQITIDYDGTALSAATNTAINSLIGKGWQVYINGVLTIPNVLSLAPAAAYSLRSFDSAADPNVVNVRRSSDSATSDFKASEVSDGTLTTWVGSGNDGHVTKWHDQGGTNHAAQAAAASQPKIVDGGVLVTDGSGNPAIIGDGVDDTLVHPTLTNELDSSDFLVTAAYKDEVAMGIVGAVPRLYLSQSSMSYYTLGTIAYTSQTDRNVVSFQVLGNTQEVFGNGASLGTASQTQVDIGQNMFNVLQAGSSFSAKPLMEVVVFGNNQSTNRTGIEKNINDTYTIY
jgi:hypothetical protein